MPKKSNNVSETSVTPEQQKLVKIWEEHMHCEFVSKDVNGTMATMVEKAHVDHVPTMTGGAGHKEIREFYAQSFISQMPPDTETVLISRTIGENQIVDEVIFKFTHSMTMDWILPGIAATGKHVEVPLVVIIGFQDGKIAREHIYWDQASVLVQLGLIDADYLPVTGIESARKLADPKHPVAYNQLIHRAASSSSQHVMLGQQENDFQHWHKH